MIKSCSLGFVTFGIYSTYTFLLNTTTVGIIIHSLIVNNVPLLTIKLVPHGIIEYFVIAQETLFPIAVWIYILRNIKKVLQRETSLKFVLKQILLFTIQTLLISFLLLLIAAVIECAISLIKI